MEKVARAWGQGLQYALNGVCHGLLTDPQRQEYMCTFISQLELTNYSYV